GMTELALLLATELVGGVGTACEQAQSRVCSRRHDPAILVEDRRGLEELDDENGGPIIDRRDRNLLDEAHATTTAPGIVVVVRVDADVGSIPAALRLDGERVELGRDVVCSVSLDREDPPLRNDAGVGREESLELRVGPVFIDRPAARRDRPGVAI